MNIRISIWYSTYIEIEIDGRKENNNNNIEIRLLHMNNNQKGKHTFRIESLVGAWKTAQFKSKIETVFLCANAPKYCMKVRNKQKNNRKNRTE